MWMMPWLRCRPKRWDWTRKSKPSPLLWARRAHLTRLRHLHLHLREWFTLCACTPRRYLTWHTAFSWTFLSSPPRILSSMLSPNHPQGQPPVSNPPNNSDSLPRIHSPCLTHIKRSPLKAFRFFFLWRSVQSRHSSSLGHSSSMVLSSSFAFPPSAPSSSHAMTGDTLVDVPSSNKRWVAATRMQAYVRKILCQGRTWDRALFDLEDLLARRSQLSTWPDCSPPLFWNAWVSLL